MKERIKLWFTNLPSLHHRIMARYLRRRDWVVFYLEPKYRKCNGNCWLELYESQFPTTKSMDPNREILP